MTSIALGLSCILMVLSASVLASEPEMAGYEITGDPKNGFDCKVTDGETVQDLTFKELDLAVAGHSNFKHIAQLYELVKNSRPAEALNAGPIIDRHHKAFSAVHKKNPNVNLRPLMHTKAVRCEIIDYANPKQAKLLSIVEPKKMNVTFATQSISSDSESVTLTTSSSNTMTRTQTASANLGFSYKGISGGGSASTSRTSEQTLSSDFEQSQEHQNSVSKLITQDFELDGGEFFGYAPDSKNVSHEVEVTFESRFSGYVAFHYDPSFGGHHYYAIPINAILGYKTSTDPVHKPPRYTATKKITTKVSKVVYQADERWKAFTSEQEYENNYHALLENHFHILSE